MKQCDKDLRLQINQSGEGLVCTVTANVRLESDWEGNVAVPGTPPWGVWTGDMGSHPLLDMNILVAVEQRSMMLGY